MDKQNLIRQQAIIVILIWLPFLLSWIFWSEVPERVPIHWNASGEPDGWGHKAVNLLLFPSITLFINGLFWALPYIDPKGKAENFLPTLRKYQIGINLFMFVFYCTILAISLGYQINMNDILPYALYGLFAILGNYFGKIQPNHFVGLRLPWTLEDEENWRKTHRMAGPIWLIGSVVAAILTALIGSQYFLWIFIPYLLILVMVPSVYSYLLFREKQSQL